MSKADPSMFFTGSASVPYMPFKRLDNGVGIVLFHSLTAMKEYANVSNDEIRMEDYNVSCGSFGSAIGNLGAALCVAPKNKQRAYVFGECYRAIMASYVKKNTVGQETNIIPSVAPTSSAPKIGNENRKLDGINGFPSNRQTITIVIIGSAKVNLVFKDKLGKSSHKENDSSTFKSKEKETTKRKESSTKRRRTEEIDGLY